MEHYKSVATLNCLYNKYYKNALADCAISIDFLFIIKFVVINRKTIYYFVLLYLMESVTIKIEENLFKRMNNLNKIKSYGTKTELIRDAIRDKLNELDREDLVREFLKLRVNQVKKQPTNRI